MRIANCKYGLYVRTVKTLVRLLWKIINFLVELYFAVSLCDSVSIDVIWIREIAIGIHINACSVY